MKTSNRVLLVMGLFALAFIAAKRERLRIIKTEGRCYWRSALCQETN